MKLLAAERRLSDAKHEIATLRERVEFEESFGDASVLYTVVRRSIDTGRLEATLGAFLDEPTATRFANGQRGYGLGKDFFIETIDFYGTKG